MGRPPITPEQRQLIKEMLITGDKMQDIADAAGVSLNTVLRVRETMDLSGKELKGCKDFTAKQIEQINFINKTYGEKARRERRILRMVKGYIKQHGYAPSYEEIAEKEDIAKSTVHQYIHALLDKGLLETDHPGVSRALRVPGRSAG